MRKEKINIGAGVVDKFYELRIPDYFMMMQTIATNDAEEKGVGKSETIDKGFSWIISRIEVDIVKYPGYTEDVIMETYPGDDMKIIFPRYYRMVDLKGNLLINSSSLWALLDIKKRVPVMSPFKNALPSEHHEGELPLPKKVAIPENLSLIESRKVRYSETDLNGHLNNTKYMDFIIDVHDSAFYEKHRIKHLAINYIHEIKDNDVVDLYTNNEPVEVIVGKVGNQLIFACEITYEDR